MAAQPLCQPIKVPEGFVKKPVKLPSSVAQRRRTWQYFGSVTQDNSMEATTIGDEVFLELANSSKKNGVARELMRQQSFYSNMAYDLNFSFDAIRKISSSKNPEEEFRKLKARQVGILHAAILEKYPNIVVPKRSKKGQDGDGDGDGVGAGSGLVGLRAKFKAAKKTLEQQAMEEEKDGSSLNSGGLGGGLRAKLSQKLKSKEFEEHEVTLFVQNVPLEFTEDDIRAELAAADSSFEVRRINIVRKSERQGAPKKSIGKCFIVCYSVEDANALLQYFERGAFWGYAKVDAQFTDPK